MSILMFKIDYSLCYGDFHFVAQITRRRKLHARRVFESQKLIGISNEILMGYHAMTLKWAVEYGSRERESELSKWECDLYAPRILR